MNTNMDINYNATDKITNYWRSSYNNRRPINTNVENTIIISKNTNHLGQYELEENTNKNGRMFIKQYKLTLVDLKKYINSRKNTYKIISNGNIHSLCKLPITMNNQQSKNVHPEYVNQFYPRYSYKKSFDTKHN